MQRKFEKIEGLSLCVVSTFGFQTLEEHATPLSVNAKKTIATLHLLRLSPSNTTTTIS